MLRLPHLINRYQVQSLIGEGSMGVVFKAYDPLIERFVALKKLRSKTFEPYFQNEIKILGKCCHPHIVQLYDVHLENDILHLIEEYIEGQSLKDFFSIPHKWKASEILSLLDSLLQTVSYLHKKGIIHRDLKPSNILVEKDFKIKLIDFGVSSLTNKVKWEQRRLLIGTPNYMSPEQCKGEKMDERSDLFSIASIFFTLLTGEKPFDGNNYTQIIFKITNLQHEPISKLRPDLPDKISQRLDAFFSRALAKNPQERFRNTEDLQESIKKLEMQNPITEESGKKKPNFFTTCRSFFLPSSEKTRNDTIIMPFHSDID